MQRKPGGVESPSDVCVCVCVFVCVFVDGFSRNQQRGKTRSPTNTVSVSLALKHLTQSADEMSTCKQGYRSVCVCVCVCVRACVCACVCVESKRANRLPLYLSSLACMCFGVPPGFGVSN